MVVFFDVLLPKRYGVNPKTVAKWKKAPRRRCSEISSGTSNALTLPSTVPQGEQLRFGYRRTADFLNDDNDSQSDQVHPVVV
jgi:hypothetical protein